MAISREGGSTTLDTASIDAVLAEIDAFTADIVDPDLAASNYVRLY